MKEPLSTSDQPEEAGNVIPLFGRDEMNIVEFPLGPVTAGGVKTYEVDHVAWDKKSKRQVVRRLTVTGSDAFGLPKPIDDQILVGMKALTKEAGFKCRKVWFSQYHFCRTVGWKPDGRTYSRLEQGFDRLAGATLKYKNAWWDKGEGVWRSHTFHLIDNVELCSSERYFTAMQTSGKKDQALCYFVWNEVVWKSFQDGYIKSMDMAMFRRIANGRRREVPLRLFRWLDKQFWRKPVVEIDVYKLAFGTLGLAAKFPSELKRSIDRAARVLVDVGYLGDVRYVMHGNSIKAVFEKLNRRRQTFRRTLGCVAADDAGHAHEGQSRPSEFDHWIGAQDESALASAENEALESGFGSKFERDMVRGERKKIRNVKEAGRLRKEFIRKFLDPEWAEKRSPGFRHSALERKAG